MSERDIVDALGDIAPSSLGWPEAKRAIHEILRLRVEVDRLRITEHERVSIESLGQALKWHPEESEILMNILERHRETAY